MNAGIYRKRVPGVMEHVYEGLQAVGWGALWQNPAVFTRDQINRKFDVVLVLGYKLYQARVIQEYNRIGTPGLVVDLGYLQRPQRGEGFQGYYQIGLNGLGWIPPDKQPADRLKELEVSRQKRASQGHYILVCGQNPEDAQHQMGWEDTAAWTSRTVRTLRVEASRPIRYRPHPYKPVFRPCEGFSSYSNPNETTLAEDLAGAWAVVTYNSTAAFEAMLAGVPVYADKAAFYSEITQTDLGEIEAPKNLSTQKLNTFLSRVAYAQWNLDEISAGLPFQFLEPYLEGWRRQWEISATTIR